MISFRGKNYNLAIFTAGILLVIYLYAITQKSSNYFLFINIFQIFSIVLCITYIMSSGSRKNYISHIKVNGTQSYVNKNEFFMLNN